MIQSVWCTVHMMSSSPEGRTTPDLQYDCEAESYRVPLRRSLTSCQIRFLRWLRPVCRPREISWASVVIDHSSSLWRKILWCPNSSRNHTTVGITCSIRHSCPITAMRMSVIISPTCKELSSVLSRPPVAPRTWGRAVSLGSSSCSQWWSSIAKPCDAMVAETDEGSVCHLTCRAITVVSESRYLLWKNLSDGLLVVISREWTES